MDDAIGVFIGIIVAAAIILWAGLMIHDSNRASATCYPYTSITEFRHGEHHFAVCAREGGPEVKLIK